MLYEVLCLMCHRVSFLSRFLFRITFWPDLGRFGMKKLDKDIVGLMSRRVARGLEPSKLTSKCIEMDKI